MAFTLHPTGVGVDALSQSMEEYLRDVAVAVAEQAWSRRGRGVLGAVPGRAPSEDEEIELDRLCDGLLDRHCERAGLSVEVHSEHGLRRLGHGPLEYLVATDPFDGSGLFRRGIPAEWWSVLTLFRPNGLEPVAGGAVDVLRRELYLADEGGVTLVSLETGARERLPSPERRLSLDDTTVLAAYLMDPVYLKDWVSLGGRLVARLVGKHPSARIWPNGGSCVYPWLARGTVHAYLMFKEPRSEIDPGLAFARAAGLALLERRPDGTLAPYRFQPERTADRVECFIAAVTEELAGEVAQAIQGRRRGTRGSRPGASTKPNAG